MLTGLYNLKHDTVTAIGRHRAPVTVTVTKSYCNTVTCNTENTLSSQLLNRRHFLFVSCLRASLKYISETQDKQGVGEIICCQLQWQRAGSLNWNEKKAYTQYTNPFGTLICHQNQSKAEVKLLFPSIDVGIWSNFCIFQAAHFQGAFLALTTAVFRGKCTWSYLTAKNTLPRWFCNSRVCPSSVGVIRSHIKLFIFSSPL